MTEKKSQTIDWQEITIQSAIITPVFPKNESINPFFRESTGSKELSSLKTALKSLLAPEVLTYFDPIQFLSTDLLGNIHLKTGLKPNSLLLIESNDIPKNMAKFQDVLKLIIEFYERNFSRDDELLDYLTNAMLKINKLSDLIKIINRYKQHNVLPLHYQIFFILVGIFENNLQNIVFSGEENNLVNILYKYKYLEISRLEKNKLYDIVVSGENPDLLGVLFHIFSDTSKGLRNKYTIFELIKDRFDSLELNDKKEFLEAYKESGMVFPTYFLMKKVYPKDQTKEWFQREKDKFGKTIPNSENCFPGYDETEDIIEKYKSLRTKKLAHTLSPFEIMLLMNTSLALQLKNEISISYEETNYSYICNRAISVIYFFEMDYKKFLLHLERSGSLKNHSECLYLKAISFMELGYKTEASRILTILNKHFPEAKVISESLLKLESE
jgi:hypothetical protein